MTKLDAVRAVADLVDGRMVEDYSGRGMFGAICLGVVCEPHRVDDAKYEGRKRRLGPASTDNMGLKVIVYWRSTILPKGVV